MSCSFTDSFVQLPFNLIIKGHELILEDRLVSHVVDHADDLEESGDLSSAEPPTAVDQRRSQDALLSKGKCLYILLHIGW